MGAFQFDVVSIILLVGFIAFVVIGAIQGFFKVLIDLGSSILSAIVSMFLAKPVGMFIYNTGCFTKVIDKCTAFLISKHSMFESVSTSENKHELIEKGLDHFNVPSALSGVLSSIGEKIMPETNGETIAIFLSKTLFVVASIIIAGLLMFALINIIVFIFKLFIKKLDEIKFVRKLNHSLGALIGAVNGCIFVLAGLVILSLLLLIPPLHEPIGNLIALNNDEVFTIGKWLYELDIIGWILKIIGL